MSAVSKSAYRELIFVIWLVECKNGSREVVLFEGAPVLVFHWVGNIPSVTLASYMSCMQRSALKQTQYPLSHKHRMINTFSKYSGFPVICARYLLTWIQTRTREICRILTILIDCLTPPPIMYSRSILPVSRFWSRIRDNRNCKGIELTSGC